MQVRFTLLVSSLACWLLLSLGCGTSSPPPKLPVLEEGINEIKLGGKTICSRGSEFAIFVRKGTVNKVIIDFAGGGACWNALTCSVAGSLFQDSVDNIREIMDKGQISGIYDWKRPENPFKDWYHILIPYCTGDIHWGNNKASYGNLQIEHKGAVNARAALDWAFKNFEQPEKVFVTGCSAGSYGSIVWAAHIAKHYEKSQIYHMGDSGAGVITDDFLKNSFPSWKAEGAMPDWIDALDPSKNDVKSKDITYIYEHVSAAYPNIMFSQFNTIRDDNQVKYFTAMGGKSVEAWSQKMRSAIERIQKKSPNFRSFTGPGDKHCIIPYEEFYTHESNGVRFIDWVRDLVNDKPISNVLCKGC